jgi:hypothetical protein
MSSRVCPASGVSSSSRLRRDATWVTSNARPSPPRDTPRPRPWSCLRRWRQTAAPMAGIDPRWPPSERARMLRATGMTMADIGAELGCAPSTVHRVLHNA